MGVLTLSRKEGQSIQITDRKGNVAYIKVGSIDSRITEFSMGKSQDANHYSFDLQIDTPMNFSEGVLYWTEGSRPNQIRMHFDIPRDINIARTELLK